jgi:hypothetical protein
VSNCGCLPLKYGCHAIGLGCPVVELWPPGLLCATPGQTYVAPSVSQTGHAEDRSINWGGDQPVSSGQPVRSHHESCRAAFVLRLPMT